jgi:hypothetical protein
MPANRRTARGDAEGRGAEDMEIERARTASDAALAAYDAPGVTRRIRDKLSVRAADSAMREAQAGAASGSRSARDYLNSRGSQRGPEFDETLRRLEEDRNRADPEEKSTKRAFKTGGLVKKPAKSNAVKMRVGGPVGMDGCAVRGKTKGRLT